MERRIFRFDRGTIDYALDSGTMLFANFDEQIGPLRRDIRLRNRRAITKDEVTAIAHRFYRLAGNEGEIDAWSIKEDAGQYDLDLQVEFVPESNGVAHDRMHSGMVEIDQLTGRLHSFRNPTARRWLPSPPINAVPRVSPARADDLSLLAVVSEGGWLAPSERAESYLCIWTPPEPMPGRTLSLAPQDQERAKWNQGQLAYSVNLDDRTSYAYSKGVFRRGFHVFVDAQDGRILQIDRFPLQNGGTSAPTIVPPLPAWPTGPRRWRLSPAAEIRWTELLRASVTPVAKASFAPTNNVLLRVDDVAVRAEFDAKRGILGIRTPVGVSLARPDARLLTALRKLTPR